MEELKRGRRGGAGPCELEGRNGKEQSMTSVRIARIVDAEAIAGIYAPYVERTAINLRTSRRPSREDFEERIALLEDRYPFPLSPRRGRVLGYA
jgi:L-amino acid N-acyltransferase YncA